MSRQVLARKYNKDRGAGDTHVLVATGIGTLLGLLYGQGDFAQSVLIAQKCRWDSDCTPATVGGLIGTVLGYSGIPPKWKLPLNDVYENYCVRGLPRWMTFTDIACDTVEIGLGVVRHNGGSVEGAGTTRVIRIVSEPPKALARQERVTPELIEKGEQAVREHFRARLAGIAERWDPNWTLRMASLETEPELLEDYMGRRHVLKIQPGARGALLESTVRLAPGKYHYLRVGAAHHPSTLCEATGQKETGSWNLEVQVDDRKIGGYTVFSHGGWVVWEDPQFDLSPYGGKEVKLTLKASQGSPEFYRSSSTSYWSDVELVTLDHPEPWR
jgi:hypothetical protein